jgi:hypothetical protein
MTDTKQKTKKFTRQKKSDNEDFKTWLANLGMLSTPNLHVNGPSHSSAVVTVDFGTPLDEPTKMNPEQSAELVSRMKALTKSLFKNETNVRVQNDQNNGVWWSTVN